MKTIDLSSYNLAQLKGLLVDIEKEVKDRQQQEVKKARDQIFAIAQDLGVSVEQLLANAGGKSKGGSGQKVQPQYHNPTDKSQTWTGRGRQPKWVAEGLARGKSLEDFRI